jgi:hypothetical protein
VICLIIVIEVTRELTLLLLQGGSGYQIETLLVELSTVQPSYLMLRTWRWRGR